MPQTTENPRVPDIQKLKLIDYDYAKFGAPAERQRIIKTWEARVRAMPQ